MTIYKPGGRHKLEKLNVGYFGGIAKEILDAGERSDWAGKFFNVTRDMLSNALQETRLCRDSRVWGYACTLGQGCIKLAPPLVTPTCAIWAQVTPTHLRTLSVPRALLVLRVYLCLRLRVPTLQTYYFKSQFPVLS